MNVELWAIEFGQLGATLKALQDFGVTSAHLDRLRCDRTYARAIASVMFSGGRSDRDGRSTSHNVARGILGRNFFGIEEWLVHYGIVLTDEELVQVSEFPWETDTLLAPCPFYEGKQIKDTHFAYLGLSSHEGAPLTIMEFVRMHSTIKHPKFGRSAVYSRDGQDNEPGYWYVKERFACNETCGLKWYLSPIDDFSYWARKPKLQQAKVGRPFPEKYTPLSAVELVTRNLLYYWKHGIAPMTEMATGTPHEYLDQQTRILCSYSFIEGDGGGIYIACPPENFVRLETEYALTRVSSS